MGHGEETWPQNSNDGLRFLREMALQKSSMGSVNSSIRLGRPNNFERHITPRGGLSLLFCVPNWMFLVPININWLRWLVNGSPADSLSLKQRLAASARVWNQPLVDNNLHRSQGQNDSIPKKLGLNPDPHNHRLICQVTFKICPDLGSWSCFSEFSWFHAWGLRHKTGFLPMTQPRYHSWCNHFDPSRCPKPLACSTPWWRPWPLASNMCQRLTWSVNREGLGAAGWEPRS